MCVVPLWFGWYRRELTYYFYFFWYERSSSATTMTTVSSAPLPQTLMCANDWVLYLFIVREYYCYYYYFCCCCCQYVLCTRNVCVCGRGPVVYGSQKSFRTFTYLRISLRTAIFSTSSFTTTSSPTSQSICFSLSLSVVCVAFMYKISKLSQ